MNSSHLFVFVINIYDLFIVFPMVYFREFFIENKKILPFDIIMEGIKTNFGNF